MYPQNRYYAFPSFMKWRKRMAAKDFSSGDLTPTFWTPAWVKEKFRIQGPDSIEKIARKNTRKITRDVLYW